VTQIPLAEAALEELERLFRLASDTTPGRNQPLASIIDRGRFGDACAEHGGERAVFLSLFASARRCRELGREVAESGRVARQFEGAIRVALDCAEGQPILACALRVKQCADRLARAAEDDIASRGKVQKRTPLHEALAAYYAALRRLRATDPGKREEP
jgi:hypothetical protein